MQISSIVMIFLFSKSTLNSLKGSFIIVPKVSCVSKLYKFKYFIFVLIAYLQSGEITAFIIPFIGLNFCKPWNSPEFM